MGSIALDRSGDIAIGFSAQTEQVAWTGAGPLREWSSSEG